MHTYIAFAYLFISLIVWLVGVWGLRRRGFVRALWMFFGRYTCFVGDLFYDVHIGFRFGCRDDCPFVTLCFGFVCQCGAAFVHMGVLGIFRFSSPHNQVLLVLSFHHFFSWRPSSFVSFLTLSFLLDAYLFCSFYGVGLCGGVCCSVVVPLVTIERLVTAPRKCWLRSTRLPGGNQVEFTAVPVGFKVNK